jgi:hypothetical protein
MKCPKCGEDNPEGTLFCEKCDWRLDQKFVKKIGFPPIFLTSGAAVLGLLSIVAYFAHAGAGAIVFGIIGMVLGGYSFTLARFNSDGSYKTVGVLLGAVGIFASIIGFLFGLQTLL